jgi:hypothetical protein
LYFFRKTWIRDKSKCDLFFRTFFAKVIEKNLNFYKVINNLINYCLNVWIKARLQELRDLEAKGHELQPEQQIAIKKLEQVVEMIELMKDLNKSVGEVFSEVYMSLILQNTHSFSLNFVQLFSLSLTSFWPNFDLIFYLFSTFSTTNSRRNWPKRNSWTNN